MPPKRDSQTTVLAGATGAWTPCVLTWYDPALGGINSGNGAANAHSPTASGEPYDPNAYTCAAPPSFPFGTVLTFRYGGTAISCRVNDRGGAITGSHFDLSRAAASALGIMGAGRVTASYSVGSVGGAPAAANAQLGGQGAGALSDIANAVTNPGSFIAQGLLGLSGDIAGQLALVLVGLVKDAAISFGDFVIVPAWHWNQRAIMYYQQQILFSSKNWTALPWTATFWGFGYWLLWTDPDSKGMKPAPVQRSRLARHTRALQAIPARRSMVKPRDVKEKTPTKPAPVKSAAPIRQVTTMRTERAQRVRVTDERRGTDPNGTPARSEVQLDRAGTIEGTAGERETRKPHPANREPDTGHRAGANPRSGGEGGTPGPTETRRPGGGRTGRGGAARGGGGNDR